MALSALLRNLCVTAFAGCVLNGIAAPLYIADHDRSITDLTLNPYGVSVAQVQADTLVATSSWRHGNLVGGELRDTFRGPIAVAGGFIDVAGPFNHRYNLYGTGQVSTICTTSSGPCGFVGQGLGVDGATDGNFNYTAAMVACGGYGVWRTDRAWANGGVLFELGALVGPGERTFGITYDVDRQSLWIQVGDFDGSGSFRFLELGLDGTLKSQFVPSFFQPNPSTLPNVAAILAGALAMDYADDSLWWIPFGDQNVQQNSGVIRLDREGHQLSFVPFGADWPSRGIIGAEFELVQAHGVPEPSSLLLVLGVLGAMAWRLKAANIGAYDEFGNSVALSADGKTLAVGAPGKAGNAKGINGNPADNSAVAGNAV